MDLKRLPWQFVNVPIESLNYVNDILSNAIYLIFMRFFFCISLLNCLLRIKQFIESHAVWMWQFFSFYFFCFQRIKLLKELLIDSLKPNQALRVGLDDFKGEEAGYDSISDLLELSLSLNWCYAFFSPCSFYCIILHPETWLLPNKAPFNICESFYKQQDKKLLKRMLMQDAFHLSLEKRTLHNKMQNKWNMDK